MTTKLKKSKWRPFLGNMFPRPKITSHKKCKGEGEIFESGFFPGDGIHGGSHWSGIRTCECKTKHIDTHEFHYKAEEIVEDFKKYISSIHHIPIEKIIVT